MKLFFSADIVIVIVTIIISSGKKYVNLKLKYDYYR